MSAIVFDTETTGIDAPEVIQVGWIEIDRDMQPLSPGYCSLFKPSKPISLGALATHHILDEDLADYPPSSSFTLPAGVEFIIGHRVDFDWQAIGSPDVKRIDVLAICRALWPTADSHTLGAMLYMLDRGRAREMLREAHNALTDCWNCLAVLQRIPPRFESFEALWQYSEQCRVPTVMAVGKHKGMPIRDLPRDYKAWFLKQPDVDPYLRQALMA